MWRLCATLLIALGSGSAWACSCETAPSIADRFDASIDVFIATAQNVRYFKGGVPGNAYLNQKAEISVEEVFKGRGEGYDAIWTHVNFRPPDANLINDWLPTSCDHSGLHAGKSYIVFSTREEPPFYDLCTHTVVPLYEQDLNELRRLRESDA